MGKGQEERVALKEGDVIEVRIVGLDETGRGIAYYRGYKVIVDDVTPGSKVVCKLLRVTGNIAYGKALKT
jgi:predicted RNA-binding protein with TRAM domain